MAVISTYDLDFAMATIDQAFDNDYFTRREQLDELVEKMEHWQKEAAVVRNSIIEDD